MGKKLLSILLTLAMLLSMIPAGFAADIEIVEDETAKESPVSDEDRVDVTADEEYYETSLPNDDIMLIETDDDIMIDPDRETRQILTAIPASDDPEYDPSVISFLFYPDAESDQYVDLTDFSGTLTVDLDEEPIPYKFVITMDHPEQISYLCVVSYTEDSMRQLTAEYDAASGTFITEGFFDEEDPYYQPQNVSLEYTVRSTAPEVGSDLDWDEIAANLGEALSNSTVVSTQDEGVTSGAIDFSKTTEDLSKLLLNYTIKEFDANCGTELAAARSYYKTGSKILAYVVPGINDSKYYVYLDYSDPNTYKMFLDDGMDVAGKAIELEMQFLDSDSQQFLALENASEFISNASTISSVVGKTYHICQETERLRQQVEQSVTIENRDEALRKVDELHDNKMGYMLLTTALPIIVAGAGVMGPAPAMLFKGIIGVMSAVSNAIYDYRIGGIVGKEVETSWYPDLRHTRGKCGENLFFDYNVYYGWYEIVPGSWESYIERQELMISGSGSTYDFPQADTPYEPYYWRDIWGLAYRADKIIIQEGVTDLTTAVFSKFESVTDIVFPNSLRSIGDYAFYYCHRLKSINIPDGVQNVGKAAFCRCTSLSSISWPESLNTIPESCFAQCTGLESVAIPNHVNRIEALAFDGCSALSSVTLSNQLTYLGGGAFADCESLQHLVLPETLEEIGVGVLIRTPVSEIVLPKSLKSVIDQQIIGLDIINEETQSFVTAGYSREPKSPFDGSGVKSVIFENGIETIPDGILSHMAQITEVIIPDSVTSIGAEAFCRCSNLRSITIPYGVTSIGSEAFDDCDSLTRVTIPNSVTSIGKCAFWFCDSLTEITIPDSVTSIGNEAFTACPALTEITVAEANQTYKSLDGVLFSKDGKELICCPGGKSGEYVIPADVTSIAEHAFAFCKKVTGVTIPDSVTSIGKWAFYDCESLTSVTIPKGVKYILEDTFNYCESLTSVTIPKSVTYIGDWAFSNCKSLTSVTIPDRVRTICQRVFQNCSGLKTVTIGSSVNYIGLEAFDDCSSLTEIRFRGSAPDFWGAFNTDKYFTGVTATAYYPEGDESWTEEVRQNYGGTITWVPYTPDPPEPEVIADGQCGDDLTWTLDDEGTLTVFGTGPMWDFEWNEDESVTTAPWAGYIDQIKTLVLSDGVTSVGNEAFDGFENLSDIRLGNAVARLGEYSFQNIGVSSLHIPASVVDISVCAIYLCSNLEEITVDEANPAYRSVDGVLFTEDMSVLVAYPIARSGPYTVPQGVKTIGNGAFQSCRGLTEIVFSEGLTSIQNYAFLGTGLTKLVLPEGVTEIGVYSFASCQSMTSAVLPQSLTVIAERAFQSCIALEDLTVSDSLERIETYAFCNCSSLKSFVVPDSLTEFEPGAVSGCASLVAFIVSAGNTSFCAIDGVLFTKDRRELVQYPAGKTDSSYSVPDGTERIRWGSFFRCRNLTEVGLPAGLLEIDDWAFEGCVNMSEISFPKDLQRIGYAAFSDCQGLTSITLPEGLGQLDEWAFGDCENIESVIILEGLTEIGGAAFYSCDSLSTVRFPASLRTIKGWAFGYCPKLKGVVLPEGLVSIEEFVFYGCSALTEISMPKSLAEIGSWAFGGSGLSEISFLGAAPVIGDDCFENVTATAYYPADDSSWTEDVRQDYGGTITWLPYQSPDDDESIVTDYTKGVATTSLEPGTSYSGETSFTVSSEGDKAVVVAVKRGDSYTLLECTTDENGVHHFTADLDEDAEIVIALKGDANLDGKVTTTDGTMIKRAAMGTYSYDSELKTLVSDVNGDGNVRTTEGTMISRAAMGTYKLPW